MLFYFSHSTNTFGFTKCQTIWANTIASEIKAAPQIWQIHTPTSRFTGWRPTIKNCATLVTNKFVHNATLFLLLKRACAKGTAKSNNFSVTTSNGQDEVYIKWFKVFKTVDSR